jgi:exopolysaccharide biosynthesis polyprenyl glycosylphosphotransferase
VRADVDEDLHAVDAEVWDHPYEVDLRVVTTNGGRELPVDGDREISLDAPAGEIRLDSPAATALPVSRDSTARSLYRALALILAGSDVLCLAAATQIAPALTVGRSQMSLPMVLVVCLVWLSVFHGFRLYTPQHLASAEMFRRVISAASVGTFLLFIITLGATPALSRTSIGLTWALALVFELGTRRVWDAWLSKLRRSRRLAYKTLIVGTNEEARRLATVLEDTSLGYEPVGHIAPPDVVSGRVVKPVLGTLGELAEAIERMGAECVFVASTAVTPLQMSSVQRVGRTAGVELRVSANLPEMLSTRLSVKPVGEVMTISLRPVCLTGTQAVLKRTFDLVLASVALVVTLPLSGVIALAIKLTSPGPVVFRQARITRGGRAFTVFKFRTMREEVDRILDENKVDKTEAFFKIRGDFAITPVGRFLRRTSLDELPQLWNIVKGDMSIVGPRPLPSEQVAANPELLDPRHEVRAGLTGWWQINGRSDVDPVDAVRMDLFYIENWSLTLDLYIVLKTIEVLIAGKGAY